MRWRSSRPRSTGWTSTSSTFKSQHEDALPLIITHGWPGSVIELLGVIGPLTDPTSYGASASDASTSWCRLCLATASPAHRLRSAGPRPHRAGVGGADAPPRLHQLRRPGRRPGRLGHRPDGPPGTRRPDRHPHEPARDDGRRHAADRNRAGTRGGRRAQHLQTSGFGYSWSRPRGRRRSATPCWIHPSPWRPGCSTTTTLTPTTRSPVPSPAGQPVRWTDPGPHPGQRHGVLADRHRDLGGPVVLGARTSPGPRGRAGLPVGQVPVGFTVFPGESFRAPRSWVEQGYPTLSYFHEADGAATSPPGNNRRSSRQRSARA